ncbi:glycogen debranching N-terminal domain-containing protein [Bacillus kwashiorkori]|uniref:amylo-alpha-1,6-glucosidase n=1 Tax=Bacillus kwashiorkori TaxID=1522318 RepID=UPI00078296C2|nr:glycogen debranching N-terminal domain-containing protein [Bacillus kwashiorkori]
MDYNVIKDGDIFLLTEITGDIDESTSDSYGLFMKDTRFLSKLVLTIDGTKPVLLSSSNPKSYKAVFHSMVDEKDKGTLEIKRERFIFNGVLYERISFINHFLTAKQHDITLHLSADFQDMFIVRKYRDGQVGTPLGQQKGEKQLSFHYVGSDKIKRETLIEWNIQQHSIFDHGTVCFTMDFQPSERKELLITINPIIENQKSMNYSFDDAEGLLHNQYENWKRSITNFATDNEQVNKLFEQSIQDLKMLMTDVGYGEIPTAGVPWYAVPFGRDSLITSLFMLPLNPSLVKGTIETLAAFQGKEENVWRDEEPGKIMHELRSGELANTNQIPFTPYYGTIDATPLFLILIAEYYQWTADLDFINQLKPNIDQALMWMDKKADPETGFISYKQNAEKGFPNQGWKDSSNSIIHKNGEYGESPIALIEVQGYAYQAKKMLAPLLKKMGDDALADKLEAEANILKRNINAYYWMEDEQYYAIALDQNNNKVESVTSNPGHLLFSSVVESKNRSQVVKRLTAEDMFSGFGIRTMSSLSTGYNPLSYHNGSVWPHDNGMILLGLSKHKYSEEAEKVITGLVKSSKHFEYSRLPELFAGHSSEIGYPIPYPTTCSPQSWSAATAIVILQVMMGLKLDGINKRIELTPVFPENTTYMEISKMPIGKGFLTLTIEKNHNDYHVIIHENSTGYSIS